MKVGVIVPLHAPQTGPVITAPSYGQIKSIALTAERAGLDSAWITDHLLFRMPADDLTRASHDAFTFWAWIAEATALTTSTLNNPKPSRIAPVSEKMRPKPAIGLRREISGEILSGTQRKPT